MVVDGVLNAGWQGCRSAGVGEREGEVCPAFSIEKKNICAEIFLRSLSLCAPGGRNTKVRFAITISSCKPDMDFGKNKRI